MPKIKKNNAYNPYGVDDGVYELVVTEVTEQESTRFNKQPFLIWNFQVMEPVRDGHYLADDEEVFVSGTTPSIPVEGQKCDKWLRACGTFIDDGEEFDTDDLVGKHVQGVIEKQPDNKTGREFSKVIKLLSLKARPHAKETVEDSPKEKLKPKVPLKKRPAATEDDAEAEEIINEVAAEEAAAKRAAAKQGAKPPAKAKAHAAADEDAAGSEEDDPFGDFDDDTVGDKDNDESDVPL